MEGQQCYTYYEQVRTGAGVGSRFDEPRQVCENVNEPFCNKKLRNLCHESTVPDCQIRRSPGSLVN